MGLFGLGPRVAALGSLALLLACCAAPTQPQPSLQTSLAPVVAQPTENPLSSDEPSAPPSRTPAGSASVRSCVRQGQAVDAASSPSPENVVATPMQLQPIGVLAEPDGSIVVGGIVAHGIALAKFLPSGLLDETFGVAGTTTLARDWQIKPERAWLGPDGTVISAAVIERSWTVCRFLADGRIDIAFGDRGTVSFPAAGGRLGSEIAAVDVQTDGSILIAGTSGDRMNPPIPGVMSPASVDSVRFAVVRLTVNGQLDHTFGDKSGVVVTDVADGRDPLHGLSVLGDGAILASGGTGQMTPGPEDNDAALVRYRADGTLDASFGVGGKSLTHPRSAAWALATIPNGPSELLVLGQGQGVSGLRDGWQAFVMRLPFDGTSDRTTRDILWFPTLFSSVPAPVGGVSFAVQEDGKLLFANGGALHRFNRDGTVDKTFGEDGRGFAIGTWQ